jgi:hypothetical protein
MKHVKLFEAWDQEMSQQEILVGFFADGGIGSHPAIIEASMLSAIKNHPFELYFMETEKLSEMPEALIAIYSEGSSLPGYDGWTIKGVSNDFANSIISVAGTDMYVKDDSGDPSPETQEAFKLAGIEAGLDKGLTILSVIPNAQINTVYWSDNQERTQGYWETPYQAVSLAKLLDKYEGYMDYDPQNPTGM